MKTGGEIRSWSGFNHLTAHRGEVHLMVDKTPGEGNLELDGGQMWKGN